MSKKARWQIEAEERRREDEKESKKGELRRKWKKEHPNEDVPYYLEKDPQIKYENKVREMWLPF